ncbi:uncharacterized protein BX663DRAFT_497857 [Cokeromyces recurvatus]|uniref:uncharacterized protein n=1 Tax=Cokeromyces recurvatus TaxID=90255 RepID=UPI00221F2E55|nr:uncharacterized protein BX663DRAFT_497857 [Cokeromyces recurvatus]KAI7905852.1 hypothetical protein BX663DRAFT_497857 [Cokeromyces recurvatus]
MNHISSTLNDDNKSVNEVDWIDTDASEDEDYLPQFPLEQQISIIIPSFKSQEDEDEDRKRSRINSLSWDINTRELFRRKLCNETPNDKVRQAIDSTIDNGLEQVDISNIGLIEIPDEIGELRYVTVLHNDIVKAASLQLYLYNNDITRINPILFQLKNLTVLSLRNNHLKFIPPEIALLENLVELSLGNNQLTYLPGELLRLKKLSILSLLPNPFISLPENRSHYQQLKPVTVTSLTEIATRFILANSSIKLHKYSSIIPDRLLHRFQSISSVHHCEHCNILFHSPDVEELVWRNVAGNHHIPVLYRFCSIVCRNNFPLIQKLSNKS